MRLFENIFKISTKSNPIFLGWSFFICIKYWFRTFHRISWFGCIRGICNSLLWAQCKFSAFYFYYIYYSFYFSQYIFPLFVKFQAIFILILLGWLFVPVYHASGVFTMPEYMKKRFGHQRIRVLLSILSLIIYVLTKLSVITLMNNC